MVHRRFKKVAGFSMLFFFILLRSQWLSAGEKAAPVIHFEKTAHTFPAVFEGKELSHTFTVFNRGAADLIIKAIKPS